MILSDDPIDLDALRVRHEFLTVPDLRASADEVAALVGISFHHADAILRALVDDGFLERTGDRYARSTTAPSNRPAARATV